MTNTSCALRLPARPAGELIDLTEVRCRLSARAEEGSLAGVAVELEPAVREEGKRCTLWTGSLT